MQRWWVLFVVAVVGAHTVCRALLWQHLKSDEAEQLILVQTLDIGYCAQPPLYTWLLWPLVHVMGASVYPLIVLRLLIVSCVFRLTYCLAHRLCVDRRFAWLATLSLLLIPEVYENLAGMWTHTMLLVVFTLGTLVIVLRIDERRRLGDYVLLGLCAGFGVQAKYNYIHFVAALAVAMLFLPRWRRILFDWRLLVSIAIAVGMALPHFGWALQHWEEIRDGPIQYTHWRQDRLESWQGILKHVASNVLWLSIRCAGFMLIPVLLFVPALRAAGRTEASPACALLGCLLVAAILLLVPLVASGTMLHVRTHWLTPFSVLLAPWFLSRFHADQLTLRGHYAYAALVVAVSLVVLSYRIGVTARHQQGGCLNALDFVYADQAQRLEAAGWRSGLAIVDNNELGAHLRLHFPNVRVISLALPSQEIADPGGPDPVLFSWLGPTDIRLMPNTRLLLRTPYSEVPSSPETIQENQKRYSARSRQVSYQLVPRQ